MITKRKVHKIALAAAVTGLLLGWAVNHARAGDRVQYKPDQVFTDRVRVEDVFTGKFRQEWKTDPVVPGQVRIRDRDGFLIGTIKQDPVFPGRWRDKPDVR
jgi:hypothetical protein